MESEEKAYCLKMRVSQQPSTEQSGETFHKFEKKFSAGFGASSYSQQSGLASHTLRFDPEKSWASNLVNLKSFPIGSFGFKAGCMVYIIFRSVMTAFGTARQEFLANFSGGFRKHVCFGTGSRDCP